MIIRVRILVIVSRWCVLTQKVREKLDIYHSANKSCFLNESNLHFDWKSWMIWNTWIKMNEITTFDQRNCHSIIASVEWVFVVWKHVLIERNVNDSMLCRRSADIVFIWMIYFRSNIYAKLFDPLHLIFDVFLDSLNRWSSILFDYVL